MNGNIINLLQIVLIASVSVSMTHSKASTYKIGVIADPHLSLTFDPYTSDCIKHQGSEKKTSTYTPFGRFGCRGTFPLYQSALAKIKQLIDTQGKLDLIILSGDYVDPRDNQKTWPQFLHPNQAFQVILDTFKWVAQEMGKNFPTIPIGYTIGNHDKLLEPFVPNSLSPYKHKEYEYLYKIWFEESVNNKIYGNEETKKTVTSGVYYSMDFPKFRFLSINTNFWQYFYTLDPIGRHQQYSWVKEQLSECRKLGKKVLISTHFPFYKTQRYKAVWAPILLEYKDIISIILVGHMHDFIISVDSEDGTLFNNEIANIALTPSDYGKTGFSIYEFGIDGSDFIPLRMQQYGMDLISTYNKRDLGMGVKFWSRIFDSEEDLGMKGLSAIDINNLYERMKTDPILAFKNAFYNVDHIWVGNSSFQDIEGEHDYIMLKGSEKWLYYWLFEAKYSPSTAPLVIYLEGKGCSPEVQMLNGMSERRINSSSDLEGNPYSWGNYAHMLFIDQPVGCGMSVAPQSEDISHTIQLITQQLIDFFGAFYTLYPELRGRNTYIVSQEYAFHYLAMLRKEYKDINYAGYMLINPIINGPLQYKKLAEFAATKGLFPNVITMLGGGVAGSMCQVLHKLGMTSFAHFACKLVLKGVEGVKYENFHMHKYWPFLQSPAPGRVASYMNREIRKTPQAIPYPFNWCSWQVSNALQEEWFVDYSEELKDMLGKDKVPVFLIFGDEDLWDNEISIRGVLKGVGWEIPEIWREWFEGGGDLGGKYIEVENLMVFKVQGAGEYPLFDKPKLALQYFLQLVNKEE